MSPDQQLRLGVIHALLENVKGSVSIGDENHGLVVWSPGIREVGALIQGEAARGCEPCARGVQICDIDIGFNGPPEEGEFVAVGASAYQVGLAGTSGQAGGTTLHTSGAIQW